MLGSSWMNDERIDWRQALESRRQEAKWRREKCPADLEVAKLMSEWVRAPIDFSSVRMAEPRPSGDE